MYLSKLMETMEEADNTGRVPADDGARGVLLLAHGGPSSLEDVPVFLEMMKGRAPSPEAVERVSERYRAIGGGSPALECARSVAEKLAFESGLPVYVGMRHWHPSIEEVIGRCVSDGISWSLVICLVPHFSGIGVGAYHRRARAAAEAAGLQIDLLRSWHTESPFVAGWADAIASAFPPVCAVAQTGTEAGMAPAHFVFTAHSLPRSAVTPDDPYEAQLLETAGLVARRLGLSQNDWTLAFQSAAGAQDTWLGPNVEEVVSALAATGTARVIVCPLGFVFDQVETLYDLDIALLARAREAGVEMIRVPAPNDSPALVEALAGVVERWRMSPGGMDHA